MNPFVSVIIPNYCHARFLDKRISSVLNQTYPNFEVIILDDKSSDNSSDIIEQYRNHPKVSSIIYNSQNSGSTFIQWNKGFNLAKGELIWLAESDDFCEPTFLENLVKEFINDKECVLAFCKSIRVDENDKYLDKIDNIPANLHINGLQFIKKYLIYYNIIANASSALFKKDIALAVDKQYMTYKGAGDRLFWIEVSEKGNVAMVNSFLNYNRKHTSNVTKQRYSDGTNDIENKRIFDYVLTHFRLNKKERRSVESFYMFNIYRRPMENESTRKKVIEFWNVSFSIKLLAFCKYLIWRIYRFIFPVKMYH